MALRILLKIESLKSLPLVLICNGQNIFLDIFLNLFLTSFLLSFVRHVFGSCCKVNNGEGEAIHANSPTFFWHPSSVLERQCEGGLGNLTPETKFQVSLFSFQNFALYSEFDS